MKYSNFITGFLLASCLFLLISANTKTGQSENVPRYHLTFGTGPIIYDAVTGKYVRITPVELKESSNLKSFLER